MKSIARLLATVCVAGASISCTDSGSTAATAQVPSPPAKQAADTGKAQAPSLADLESGTYSRDAGHAYITFSYVHQGYSVPYARFRSFEATLEHNAQDPGLDTVTVDVDLTSVDTGVDELDEHLRSDDFFDVAKHPTATFRSTAFAPADGRLDGVLTIKNISKPVSLDVKVNKVGKTRSGEPKIGVSARGEILRSDFGVDRAVPFVSDKVSLIIEAEFEKAN